MKRIMSSAVCGIGIAMMIFCMIGVVFDITNGGSFQLDNYGFSKMAIGCLFVGLGFGVPSVVYDNEKLPFAAKTIIHMGTGCLVYTIVAFAVGWIPTTMGIMPCVISLLGEIAVAFIMWFGFLVYYKNSAKKMNERIKEMTR